MSLYSRIFTVGSLGALPCAIDIGVIHWVPFHYYCPRAAMLRVGVGRCRFCSIAPTCFPVGDDPTGGTGKRYAVTDELVTQSIYRLTATCG